MATRRYGRLSFETSNENKVLFPDCGLTKGDLIEYYDRIANVILPYLRDRPLVMRRFPDGITKPGFYQKQTGSYFPEWVPTVTVKKTGGTQKLAVCNNRATLAYLANQAVVGIHPWLCRRDRLYVPDLAVIDLDAGPSRFAQVKKAARCCKRLLDELELPAFLKTTGSAGLHVVIPLRRKDDFDAVRAFTRDVAGVLAGRHPELVTTEQRKNKRRGRVYLDVGRNAYAQTVVAPYAVRPIAGAPVATPIEWEELSSAKLHARAYTMRNVFRRLSARDDPWAGIHMNACALARARKTLEALIQEKA